MARLVVSEARFLNQVEDSCSCRGKGYVMKYENIELLRRQHNLTLQEVADALACQREVYRRYEKGTRELPVSSAKKLAKLYEVSLDYLLAE